MNDYDKAGRYLVKRDPVGFFRWLLANRDLEFRAWIDSRRVALPNQKDLTNDLVAALQSGDALEAFCLELESEARADALPRQLSYLTRLWTEPGRPDSLPVSCVCSVILDLSGRSAANQLSLNSAISPPCRLEISVLRHSMMDADATRLVVMVEAQEASPWLLGWVPLMHGGGDSGIIAQWLSAAEHCCINERDRSDLGLLALVFSTLGGCRPAWDRALKGWNMQTSPVFDEIRALGRQEGREEGREEGVRTTVLRLGRQKFGKAPTKKQLKSLASSDLTQLESLAERLLHVESWAALLSEI